MEIIELRDRNRDISLVANTHDQLAHIVKCLGIGDACAVATIAFVRKTTTTTKNVRNECIDQMKCVQIAGDWIGAVCPTCPALVDHYLLTTNELKHFFLLSFIYFYKSINENYYFIFVRIDVGSRMQLNSITTRDYTAF